MWKNCLISDLGNIVGGATPSTKDPDNYNGDIPWITPKDLSSLASRYISRGERNISKKGYNSCSTQLVPAGTVLFSSRAPIGYIAIAENELCTNQGFKSIEPNEDTDSLFLYYLLLYNKDRIESKGSGTTFKEVSGTVMKNISVKVPELSKQRVIATTLSCLDGKIEVNNRINANLEAQAQAIFDNWFSSAISDSWLVGTLSDIANLNPQRSLSKGVNAIYVEMSNLPKSGPFPNGWENKAYNGGARFRNGDTLLARITPCLENGKTAYVNFLEDNQIAFGSTEYIVLSPKEGYPGEMLYFLARDNDFVSYAVKNMSGTSGRQRVSAAALAGYEMKIPPIDFVSEYTDVFIGIMEIIRHNSLENRTLAALRDTLLLKLMSGEIEVPIDA